MKGAEWGADAGDNRLDQALDMQGCVAGDGASCVGVAGGLLEEWIGCLEPILW